jgi:hypothetical protein
MRWLILLALAGACSEKKADAPKGPPALPAGEVQRGQDACNAYVAKICACTAPAAQKQCALAKALPEAMQLALATAANPTTEHNDALRALTSVRETTKECIEQTARLPALGCSP